MNIIKNLISNLPFIISFFGVIFFFCIFRIILGNSVKKDTQNRMMEIYADGPTYTHTEKKKKKGLGAGLANKLQGSSKLRKKLRKLEGELYDVGIEYPVGNFILYWVGSVLLLCTALMVMGVNRIFSVIITFAIALYPAFLISSRRRKRCAVIESQLIDCMQLLGNALKAGYSFNQAMNTIAQEMDGPISEEFGRVYLETQNGMSLTDSLEAMCERVGSDDLSMMCTAVIIQRQVGGNLTQILENITGTIKKRLSLKADIKVKTASGRISGIIIGCLPVLLFVLFLVINPSYMTFFTSGKAGLLCIGFCIVMEMAGFFVINKIITIEY